jgi:hypothetical protein
MLNARSIQGIIAIALVLFLAIWLGMALVTDQFETLLKIGGAIMLLTGAFLGRKIWLLFILFTSMNVMLYRWIGTIEFGQALFIGFSALLFLMRKLHYRVRFGELELWALLIIACIIQAYLRNPVGLNIFGAGNVGGRPYVVIALWIISSAILSCLVVPPKEIKWALRLSIIGGFLGIPLQMARYGNLSSTAEEVMDLGSGNRIASFTSLSTVLARWLSSRISPLKACLHPLWALVLLFTVALAAASGYRNTVANVGFILLVAICYHGGLKSFIASLLIAAFALGLLALINLNFPLPGNIQRALSPLPGTWEERYLRAGDTSTEWRTMMWKEALTTDKWIHNKILGDGIGIKIEDLSRMVGLESGNSSNAGGGLSNQQEQMMILDAYHSGPLHSIRMTGYIGLIVLVLAMIRTAMHAHYQILRCKGTEWASVAIFFGIPLIAYPFLFIFVFGEYHVGVAHTMMGMAMIRLMERNIPLPAYVPWSRRNYVPLVVRTRSA